MADSQTNSNVVYNGPYQTKQEHLLNGKTILQAAIDSYEEAATKIAIGMISDAAVRQKYAEHVKQISDEVKKSVESGKISTKEGAEYCNQMRDKLFVEYRKYTSAIGVAQAEEMKLTAKGMDFYLNKYAEKNFSKKFLQLSQEQRSRIYYDVIASAGRGNATVTMGTQRLRALGTVMVLFTGVLAVGEIIAAKDKIREAARQGSIIAAGMIGGAIAGGAVSFLCGPAEPVCAAATVTIGANLGGMAGQYAYNLYQNELAEFNNWIGM